MEKQIVLQPIYLKKNVGLGNALRIAIQNCSFDLIARMDSDDISMKKRFELQLKEFEQDLNLDIVGGNITEFVGEESNIIARRIVFDKDIEIKKDMKKRCAMNHMSVMYKKNAVQKSGGYLDWPWNEDYYLWIRMMESNCKFKNLAVNLVNVRVGMDMSSRRGGWNYFKSEQKLQKYMLKHEIINLPRYLYNILIRFIGEVVVSNTLRAKLFRFVRKPYNLQAEKEDKAVLSDGSEKRLKVHRPFSVAMSVYGKDNAEWFDVALASIVNQTVKPNEIILVVDGPIPEAIQNVINKYDNICKGEGGDK